MIYRAGGAAYVPFVINTSAGLTDAGSLPTASLLRNGSVDGAVTVTVTRLSLGRYVASFTVPSGYAAGDDLSVSISATVSSVPYGSFEGEGTVESSASATAGALAYMGPLRASVGGTVGSEALVLVLGEDKGILIGIVDHAGKPFSLSGLTDDDLTAEVHNAAGTLLLSPTVAIESDLGGLVLLTGWSTLTTTAQRDLFLTIKIDGGAGNIHITEPAPTQVLAR